MPRRMSVTPVASQTRTPEGGAIIAAPITHHHTDRQERHRRARRQNTPPRLAAPVPQQTAADVIPPRDLGKARAGLLRLRHDPQLLLTPPAAAALNAGNDLHPAACSRS